MNSYIPTCMHTPVHACIHAHDVLSTVLPCVILLQRDPFNICGECPGNGLQSPFCWIYECIVFRTMSRVCSLRLSSPSRNLQVRQPKLRGIQHLQLIGIVLVVATVLLVLRLPPFSSSRLVGLFAFAFAFAGGASAKSIFRLRVSTRCSISAKLLAYTIPRRASPSAQGTGSSAHD